MEETGAHFYGPSNRFINGGMPIKLGPGNQQLTFCALLNHSGEW